jgi:hypothetical protein
MWVLTELPKRQMWSKQDERKELNQTNINKLKQKK